MKEAFTETRFNEKSRGLIKTANDIIEEYAGQGFQLTLRHKNGLPLYEAEPA